MHCVPTLCTGYTESRSQHLGYSGHLPQSKLHSTHIILACWVGVLSSKKIGGGHILGVGVFLRGHDSS